MSGVDAPGAWKPLLSGAEAERVVTAVRSLVAATEAIHRASQQTLGNGQAGLALFWASAGDALQDEDLVERGFALLATAAAAPPARDWWALFESTLGVACVHEHLVGGSGDEGAELDEALLEWLDDERIAHRPFDLLGGLAGVVVYALERGPQPTARACVDRALALLTRAAERRPGAAAWRWSAAEIERHTREPGVNPDGLYCLGVARGVAGVIGALARARAAGLVGADDAELLDDAVTWLLSCVRLDPEGEPRLPAYLDPDGRASFARWSWCMGESGIAGVLLMAAETTGQRAWRDAALEIGRRVARRADVSPARDAHLCCGAAGLAQVMMRLHLASGEQCFADAARRALAQVLSMTLPDGDVVDLRAWPPDWSGQEVRAGLLRGIAGVGLVLLSAALPIEPSWDRLLLLSLPRSPG